MSKVCDSLGWIAHANDHGPTLPEYVTIPVDTEPGEVAQVAFGYAGKLWDSTTGTRPLTN